jgi:hypothetical protein
MGRALAAGALAAVVLFAAAPAGALSLLWDNREVFSSEVTHTRGQTPDPLFSDFAGYATALGGNFAQQVSSVGADAFAGSGGAWTNGPTQGYAYSYFFVLFELDEPTPWSLEGELGGDAGSALAFVRLQQDPLNDGPDWLSNDAGPAAFAGAGLLPTGVHGLTLFASVSPDPEPQLSTFSFRFELGASGAAVPEPGGATLFALGAALLAGARRRSA